MQGERAVQPTRLWILRHGRSTLNDAQTFQGCGAESELTAEGIHSAECAGARLAWERLDAVYTSPLRRAVQTAELVRGALQQGERVPAPEVAEALRETELPGWEGLTYAKVRERYPEQLRRFHESPGNFSLRDAEGKERWPVLEMEQRVHRFLSRLLSTQAGKSILLVTHGGPARIMLLAALRLSIRSFNTLQISHGGLSCVTAHSWPDRLHLDVLNEMSHIEAKLPKLKDGKDGLRLLLVASADERVRVEEEETLAQMIERLPIHRALAAGQEGVTAAMRLLRYRRRSTIETCTEAGLRGAIERQLSRQRPNEVVNLLITGRGEALREVVQRSMRWDDLETPPSLGPCQGLSVVHLPRTAEHPVLQAVNTFQATGCPAGEAV